MIIVILFAVNNLINIIIDILNLQTHTSTTLTTLLTHQCSYLIAIDIIFSSILYFILCSYPSIKPLLCH